MSASIGMTDTSSASAAPLSDIPPDITQLGLKIYPFVSAVDAQRIYAKLRDEVTDLKAKLSKTSKDLNHVGHELDQMVKKNTKLDDELDQMVKKNAKLDDELKIIQIDKQSLAKRLDLAMLAASESKTTKNDDAFIAIEGELKEYKKELSVAKEQLRLAHKKVFEAKLHIETLAEEKRVIELSNTKLVARNKRWDDHTHEEQLQLQEQRNDLKKQQDFLTQYERSLIDKGYKLEDQEEKIFKKEQELTRRTKEMEKKSSDLIDMEKRLKGKEKYLTEWSFELTHKQETADQEKSALRIKQQEYRELQDALAQSEASMKLSQERFLKFTSRPVLSAIAANTSYPKSSDSQETIKFETKVGFFPTFF
jgi:DNA repair exonuclease SbcCD ATPase subunit